MWRRTSPSQREKVHRRVESRRDSQRGEFNVDFVSVTQRQSSFCLRERSDGEQLGVTVGRGFVWLDLFTMETAYGQTVCTGGQKAGRWGHGVKAPTPYRT
ncbi:hypothetical protein EYF80_004927 [Liparis tanakae]|uniref:Uncharacterized protein n=1 Tax=Liparis tanakae TaxID=230148 RepID=A0A4Z2J5V9_9TELE|nr:hypothetical protein EYF80_004927 [Liparis tanakae]